MYYLQSSLPADGQFSHCIISSIYFDSYNAKSLQEKINSDFIKSKVRLRWYQNMKTLEYSRKSYLEIKIKAGSRREKFRYEYIQSGACIENTAVHELNLFEIIKGTNKNGNFISDFFNYLPFIQINYKRHRFIDPLTNSRICIDFDINVSRVNNLIFPGMPMIYLKDCVFEIKGSCEKLPESLSYLRRYGMIKTAFSKYLKMYGKNYNQYIGA